MHKDIRPPDEIQLPTLLNLSTSPSYSPIRMRFVFYSIQSYNSGLYFERPKGMLNIHILASR